MKIGKGVEWAAHACAILAALPEGWTLSREALAEFLGVPDPYLAKQMQALSRAGIVSAQRGVAGGYRLAKPADTLSLWDVTSATEGAEPLFRCAEVRQNGPCALRAEDCSGPCEIAQAFWQAEASYRDALSKVLISDLVSSMSAATPSARRHDIRSWIETAAGRPAA